MRVDAAATAEIRDAAVINGWRLVVLFGSSAFGEGRDVDIAVIPEQMPDLWTQARWQNECETIFAPKPVDLVVLDDTASPVLRFEVFRRGRCLFEAVGGLFDREADRAFFLYADSRKFRDALREHLRDSRS